MTLSALLHLTIVFLTTNLSQTNVAIHIACVPVLLATGQILVRS
jgi:hypothetical protein